MNVICVIVFIICIYMLFPLQDDSNMDKLNANDMFLVERGTIEQFFFANAVMEPNTIVDIGAQVNGLITRLHVKEGDFVKEGQILLEIDPTLQQNEVNLIKSRLKSSESAYKQTAIDLEWSEKELSRKKVLSDQGIISRNSYLEYKKDYDKLKLQSEVNKENTKQILSELQSAKAKLGYTKIVSPIDGQVLGVLMQQGQTIVSSQNSPNIILLADTSIMRANISISEHDISKVKVGDLVQGLENGNFRGTIESVRNAPNNYIFNENRGAFDLNESVVYRVFSSFNNHEQKLLTGMNIPVKITTSSINVEKVIRKFCLSINNNKFFTLVNSEKGIVKKEVNVGISNIDFIEVTSGLSVGDEVVCEQ